MNLENSHEINVKVLAFSGFKGSGKDTVAEIISNEIEYKKDALCIITSMADPIRSIVNTAFVSNPSNMKNYKLKEQPIKVWSERLKRDVSYRDFLNEIGMTMRKMYGSKLWVWNMEDRIDARINNLNLIAEQYNIKRYNVVFIIPDIRYKQEIKMLNRMRSKYDVEHWLILRKSALPEWAQLGLHVTDPVERKIIKKDFKPTIHESDWCFANPKFQRVITNDGSYDDLRTTLAPIAESLVR